MLHPSPFGMSEDLYSTGCQLRRPLSMLLPASPPPPPPPRLRRLSDDKEFTFINTHLDHEGEGGG